MQQFLDMSTGSKMVLFKFKDKYEGESIKNQPNLFLGEIDPLLFRCNCPFE